ncbi:MAG: TonB-dependent receptor [Gemmatimonadota bacterium]|nr:TonB-dependent receptor [Gemmatimonadota bacterium]
MALSIGSFYGVIFGASALIAITRPTSLVAQADATLSGHVTGTTGKPLQASVHLLGTRLGATADPGGAYRVDHISRGVYHVLARIPGYVADTETVDLTAGGTVNRDFRLRASVALLARVVVTASARLAETKAAALDSMKHADNIKYVESGDDIRSLPSLNVAEAAERIPGVSTERDEGEGKFVQIRGTEPRLQNVTIDGAHVPGTLNGNRSVKLDDIPSDIIGAIEVSKTLSADQDADAIGGSVNLLTKIPQSSPRGYVSGLFGVTTIQSRTAGQGSFTYGGRVGQNRKLGFLIGASYDRNNRPINDVEPFWGANAVGTGFYPSDFNQRFYLYSRDRYGVNGDLDYQIDPTTHVFLRGLYSRFLDHGIRHFWDVASNADSVGASNVRPFIGAQGTSSRQVEQRTPTENTYGFTTGITKQTFGPFRLDASANVTGSSSNETNYRDSNFGYTGPAFSYVYDNSNVLRPRYSVTDPALKAALLDPSNYAMTSYDFFTNNTTARELGGRLNLLLPYQLGSMPASLKFGAEVSDLVKRYVQNNAAYSDTASSPVTLAALSGGATNHNYYANVFPGGIDLGPMPSNERSQAYENANPQAFALQTGNAVANALASYDGHERITSAYVMHDVDINHLHVNLGMRLESTFQDYRGFADTVGSDFASPTAAGGVQGVSGRHTYNDVFPSAQFRYALDNETNLRLSVTRGIARPDYTALAPTTLGTPNSQIAGGARFNQSVIVGNPNLHAEYAWNYDLLFEHYLPHAGLIAAGVFYKDLHAVIYNQRVQNYRGPIPAYQGAAYTVPLNGPGGHIIGWEADWEQHLTFLPGLLSGLSFNANWTHVDSYALVPSSTFDSTSAGYVPSQLPARRAPLFRTSPNVGNVSGIYELGPVYARVAWAYQGPNINSYGDGSYDPTTADTYFYAHSQVDMSLYVNMSKKTQVQFQVLNLNNAVFGFFNGTPNHQFDVQREYYGKTFYFGLRQAIQ